MYTLTYEVDPVGEHNFDYTPEREELKEALAKLIAENFHMLDHVEPESRHFVLEALERFIDTCGLVDSDELCDEFLDELKEHFEPAMSEQLYERR